MRPPSTPPGSGPRPPGSPWPGGPGSRSCPDSWSTRVDSLAHMRLGVEMLATRGSGGARLALTAAPVPFADELVERGARLGDVLVARSSTIIESSGEWSGAFTSYLDLSPTDLPRAVTGCWASAFSVAALERQNAARVDPRVGPDGGPHPACPGSGGRGHGHDREERIDRGDRREGLTRRTPPGMEPGDGGNT